MLISKISRLILLATGGTGRTFEDIAATVFPLRQKVFGFGDALYSKFKFSSSQNPVAEEKIATGTFDPTTWTLTTDTYAPNHYQTAPYVANGYFGQALPSEGVGYWIERNFSASEGSWELNGWPLDQPRATFGTIAGFWNLQEKVTYPSLPANVLRGGESVISGIPDWTGLVVTTNKGISYMPGVKKASVTGYQQSVSLQNGIVRTNVTWKPHDEDEIVFHLNFTVLAHRKYVNLGLVRLDLSVNKAVNFTITDVIDGAGATRAHFGDKEFLDDMIWTSVKPWGIENVTAYVSSTVDFASTNADEIEGAGRTRTNGCNHPWVSQNLSTIAASWNFSSGGPRTITIFKYVGIASSDAFPNAQSLSFKTALNSKNTPWETLIKEHNDAWDSIWDDTEVEIPGDEELQITARGSLFHLLANARPGTELPGLGDSSIMVSGLSGDSYAGLIFWDSDTWMYPPLLALFPDYAMSINNYRTRLLPMAIENAQSYGYAGLLFPWTSGRFGNCTGTGLCKDYQYHLDFDVALSHWQYYLHTKDEKWLRDKGWPIIKGAADMFANYVTKNKSTGKFETILMGEPDEFAYNIDNGAYTNAGIKILLKEWAPYAAKELSLAVPKNWSYISDNMELLYDEDENMIIEHSSMDGTIHIKQASVTLINYPLGWNLNERQAQNDMAFYAAANSPHGPAMTWPNFAINTLQLAETGCAAYTYLLHSYEPYMRAPFYQFSEQASDDWHKNGGTHAAFPFLTGYGGYLQIFTHGFTGMRAKVDALFLDPVMVPQIPEGVNVKGVKYQGGVFDIKIGLHETIVERRRIDEGREDHNEPVIIRIGGKASQPGDYPLSVGGKLVIPTRRPDLNGTAIVGNIAQCQRVTSDNEWVAGRYPLSAVDGSNATLWQPLSPKTASIVIDLGLVRTLSEVLINWGNIPAIRYTLFGSTEGTEKFEEMVPLQDVKISAPYVPEEAKIVKIRSGNETIAKFSETFEARYVKLEIEGTQGNDGQAGATVAEIAVF